MPRPGFPKTVFEFNKWFPDEEACLKFLIQSRWPDGFVCPRCGFNDYYWIPTRKLLQCKQCGYQASVTAGTVMHRSRMPLRVWFQAAYLVTTHTPGMSALQFQRQMGLSSYQTAFTMLHKLRAAMVRGGRDRISGFVEVDETYIGGERPGPTGRGALGKVIVAGAVDIKGKSANRIRLRVIPNVTGETLTDFIKSSVQEGSTIKTDDWRGYSRLKSAGYGHIVSADLIHIHRVFSNLKTWLIGTHHGVSKQHLQAYLNEYTFRFNRRGTPMAAFQTVLGLAKERLGPTYKGLYGVAKGRKTWEHPTNPLTKMLSELLR
ncbi:MAG: IS1595 family transposase [Chloroflexi bacterium]|nr:IS1595 family transposase [Chloroflexota bacterium]